MGRPKRKAATKTSPGIVNRPPLQKIRVEKLYNSVRCYDGFQRGRLGAHDVRNLAEYVVSDRLKKFEVLNSCSCLTRRVTALAWLPGTDGTLIVGSKGGELILCSLKKKPKKRVTLDDGIGPGGSILSIAFDPQTPSSFYTASLDGTVKSWTTEKGSEKVLLNTGTFDRWYCSVNASANTGLLLAGDTSGHMTILSSRDKGMISKHKFHKGKITTAETCKKTGWLLATASTDKTVKIWDVRKIQDKNPLETLMHERAVNSAFLSSTDSGRLLTTDQHSQLRVYRTGDWALETLIIHPHRQFQHLTAIKASWHPLCDLIVVGRYPDPAMPDYVKGETRSIDVFNCRTGQMMAQLSSPACKGIMSLNVFDPTGEYLATGMGLFVPIWVFRDPLQDNNKRIGKCIGFGNDDNDDNDDDMRSPPSKKMKKGEKKVQNSKKKEN